MVRGDERSVMEAHLRAGVAIYNDGYYHAAHDAWEERWLDLPEGSDRDFLQGLIQFTAAVYHTTGANWEGARGLAGSALDYLDGLGSTYLGVELDPVRSYLAALAEDPEETAGDHPPLAYEGATLELADLAFEATAIAAQVLAAELGHDEATVERGAEYARRDLEAGAAASTFAGLVFEYVRNPDRRGAVLARLRDHVDRRASRDADVDGLFDRR